MAGKRTRHARGSVVLNERVSGDVWYFRFKDSSGIYRGIPFATFQDCPTRSAARIEADRQRLPEKHILPNQSARRGRKTFGDLIARYKAEEMPERFSTRHSYESWLNLHIAPRWGNLWIDEVKAAGVEQWLKDLPLSTRSKGHIKGIIAVLFDQAMKWEWIPQGKNPMELFKVRGASKRKVRPKVLTPEQLQALIGGIDEPFVRMVVIVSMCLGLRLSEVLGLKWADMDWREMVLEVRRGVVQGRLGDVKTEYSEAPVEIDQDLAELLADWKRQAPFSGDDDWIFASPFTYGKMPYFPTAIRRKIHAAATAAGIGHLVVGEPTKILRHSYRSWLGMTDTPLAVIKDLMRHSDVRTTFNDYGNGARLPMRKANQKIASMVLRPN